MELVTFFNVENSTETLWKSLSLIVIFDVLENEIKSQARKGRKVLEDVSIWLNNSLFVGSIRDGRNGINPDKRN
ncbi:hypothetical protein IQ238_06430 [Pleurocapsales cyanobacterium LEGE 06147]|nr:hypothetical protein [Pleurocapsales cyanobacterium LEGE 06147]